MSYGSARHGTERQETNGGTSTRSRCEGASILRSAARGQPRMRGVDRLLPPPVAHVPARGASDSRGTRSGCRGPPRSAVRGSCCAPTNSGLRFPTTIPTVLVGRWSASTGLSPAPTTRSFDPVTAARLEVEWWRVHREHQHRTTGGNDDGADRRARCPVRVRVRSAARRMCAWPPSSGPSRCATPTNGSLAVVTPQALWSRKNARRWYDPTLRCSPRCIGYESAASNHRAGCSPSSRPSPQLPPRARRRSGCAGPASCPTHARLVSPRPSTRRRSRHAASSTRSR